MTSLSEALRSIDKALIKGLRDDYLKLMRNVPRVRDERSFKEFRDGVLTFAGHLSRHFFGQGVSGGGTTPVMRAFALGQKGNGRRKDNWAYWDERIRTSAWNLHQDITDVPGTRYSANGASVSFLVYDWDKNRDRWRARLVRKAKDLWDTLEAASSFLSDAAVDVSSPESFSVEGLEFRVLSPVRHPRKLRRAASLFKVNSRKRLPWLWNNRLLITIVDSGLSVAGRYLSKSQGIELGIFAISTSSPEEVVRVIAHEFAHHLWHSQVSQDAKAYWKAAIEADKKDLDLEQVLKDWPQDAATLYDYVERLKRPDPVRSIQLMIVLYAQDFSFRALRFNKREDISRLISSGTRTMTVPAHPVTAYGSKNPEETFCEAVGNLVAYGPKTVHPLVRSLLRAVLGSSVRTESTEDWQARFRLLLESDRGEACAVREASLCFSPFPSFSFEETSRTEPSRALLELDGSVKEKSWEKVIRAKNDRFGFLAEYLRHETRTKEGRSFVQGMWVKSTRRGWQYGWSSEGKPLPHPNFYSARQLIEEVRRGPLGYYTTRGSRLWVDVMSQDESCGACQVRSVCVSRSLPESVTTHLPISTSLMNGLVSRFLKAVRQGTGRWEDREGDHKAGAALLKAWSDFLDYLRHEIPLLPKTSSRDPSAYDISVEQIVSHLDHLTAFHSGTLSSPTFKKVRDWKEVHAKVQRKQREVATKMKRALTDIALSVGVLSSELRKGAEWVGRDFQKDARDALMLSPVGYFHWRLADEEYRERHRKEPPKRREVQDAVSHGGVSLSPEHHDYHLAMARALEKDARSRLEDPLRQRDMERYRKEVEGHLRTLKGLLRDVVRALAVKDPERRTDASQFYLGREPKKGEVAVAVSQVPRSGSVGGVEIRNDIGLPVFPWKHVLAAVSKVKDLLDRKNLGFLLRSLRAIRLTPREMRKVTVVATGEELQVGGTYSPSKKEITVQFDGQYDLVSSPSRNHALVELLVHEIGHHFYYSVLSSGARVEHGIYFKRAKDYPTAYAQNNPSEDFAESFMAYVSRSLHVPNSGYSPKLTPDIWERFRRTLMKTTLRLKGITAESWRGRFRCYIDESLDLVGPLSAEATDRDRESIRRMAPGAVKRGERERVHYLRWTGKTPRTAPQPEWEKFEGQDILRIPGEPVAALPSTGRRSATKFVAFDMKTRDVITHLSKGEVRGWLLKKAEKSESVSESSWQDRFCECLLETIGGITFEKSFHSMAKYRNGLWASEKQAKYLLRIIRDSLKEDRQGEIYGVKIKKALDQRGIKDPRGRYFLITGEGNVPGSAKRERSRIRIVWWAWVLDDAGLVLRVKLGAGTEPNYGRAEVTYKRPEGTVTPAVDMDAEDKARADAKKNRIEGNRTMLSAIEEMPNWKSDSLVVSFREQLLQGRKLSPKQLAFLQKKMGPKLFSRALGDEHEFSPDSVEVAHRYVLSWLKKEEDAFGRMSPAERLKRSGARDPEVLLRVPDAADAYFGDRTARKRFASRHDEVLGPMRKREKEQDDRYRSAETAYKTLLRGEVEKRRSPEPERKDYTDNFAYRSAVTQWRTEPYAIEKEVRSLPAVDKAFQAWQREKPGYSVETSREEQDYSRAGTILYSQGMDIEYGPRQYAGERLYDVVRKGSFRMGSPLKLTSARSIYDEIEKNGKDGVSKLRRGVRVPKDLFLWVQAVKELASKLGFSESITEAVIPDVDEVRTIRGFRVGRATRFVAKGKWGVLGSQGELLGGWEDSPEEAVSRWEKIQASSQRDADIRTRERDAIQRALKGKPLNDRDWRHVTGGNASWLSRSRARSIIRDELHLTSTYVAADRIISKVKRQINPEGYTLYDVRDLFRKLRERAGREVQERR